MNKDKEVEVVDSREVEANLTMGITDLTIPHKIKVNINGKVKEKSR